MTILDENVLRARESRYKVLFLTPEHPTTDRKEDYCCREVSYCKCPDCFGMFLGWNLQDAPLFLLFVVSSVTSACRGGGDGRVFKPTVRPRPVMSEQRRWCGRRCKQTLECTPLPHVLVRIWMKVQKSCRLYMMVELTGSLLRVRI